MVRVGLARGEESYDAVRRALELIREDVRVPHGLPVLLKPNFTAPTVALSTTTVGSIQATMDFLMGLGVKRFIIGETASGDAMKAFEQAGYLPLKKSYDVEFRDLNQDEVVTFELLDSALAPAAFRLAKSYFTSYVVSVSCMKSHNAVVATLAIKNMAVGSIMHPDRETFSHAPQPINLSIARLNRAASPGLAVIDGVVGMEGDGPIDGTPVRSGIALAGTDALAVDSVGAELMGFDPRTIGYLWYLSELNGLARNDIEVVGEDPSRCITHYKAHEDLAKHLAWWVDDWTGYLEPSAA